MIQMSRKNLLFLVSDSTVSDLRKHWSELILIFPQKPDIFSYQKDFKKFILFHRKAENKNFKIWNLGGANITSNC